MINNRLKLIFPILFVIIFQACAYSFSFAVFGDNGDGDLVFLDIIKRINADPSIVFVINTGDIVTTGKLSQYKHYLSMTSQLKVKTYNVMGNHDIIGAGRINFLKFFGNPYYSWDYENCHFIVLDNVSQYGLGTIQTKWLTADLENNQKPVVFIFMHKPMSDPSGSFSQYLMGPENELTALKKLFQRNNVKYVFCGHIHCYGKIIEDQITYIITGGAGSHLHLPNFAGGFFNYIKVTVNGNNVSDKVMRLYSE